MRARLFLTAALATGLCATLAFAATIKLRDGTTIVGQARKIGGSYSITLPDGSRQLMPASEVVAIDGKPVGDPPAASGDGPSEPSAANTGGASFRLTKSTADRADAPIVGLQVWEDFIEKNPDSPDIETAKAERESWEKLYKEKAERIRGKWLGGEELKDLKKKCAALMNEAVDPRTMDVKGVSGLRKLDEVIALYPNHFEANFYKGYYLLVQATEANVGALDYLSKGIAALERTAQIAPNVPEVWCNLAIGYSFRREYQKSIECAYRAVKMRDDDKLVAVLANAIYRAPPQMRDVNPKVRKINEDAQVLFRAHNISGPGRWYYLTPTRSNDDKAPDDVKATAGVQWSGSGFFITPDGYFLTNRHVATGESKGDVDPGLTFRVRLNDGTERSAELIAVGDNCDIALMKIKTPKSVPFLKIAEVNPNQGADAMVLGYPATGIDDYIMQISVGKVKSTNSTDEFHVWYDLNTTHGNSGGPVVDKYGRVISILTAGRTFANQTILLGVGPDQMETFLDQMKAKSPALKVDYEPLPATPTDAPLNSEKLTIDCRPSTLLVLAVRGDGKKAKTPANADKPDDGDDQTTKP